MTAAITPITQRPARKALAIHHEKIRNTHLRDLFALDPKHGERLTAAAVGFYLDYSRHRITAETLTLLLQLADESDSRPCQSGVLWR